MGPNFKGFAPGWRSDVGRRTKAMPGEVFSVGRMVGRLTAEKKRRKNFILGSPLGSWMMMMMMMMNAS